MDTSKTNTIICCPQGPMSSLQLDKTKEHLEFFKNLLPLVNRIEKSSKEVQISLCPVAIRFENKYKCCKARIADMEGKLEKVEEDNKTLKDKLNAMQVLSGYQHLIKLRGELEIQKWERFESETMLKQIVTLVKDVNKAIVDILKEIQSGESQNIVMPQTSTEMEGLKETKKVSDKGSVNILAGLHSQVNNQLEKLEGMQKQTKSELRILFETVKKMEDGFLQRKDLNAKRLPRVAEIPSENDAIFRQMVAHVKSVNKVIADILTELQSGENQNVIMPQTNIEMESPEVTTKRLTESINVRQVFADLNTYVSNQLKNLEGMQMKTKSEMRTLFENLKKIEGRLVKRKNFETLALSRVEATPTEKVATSQKILPQNVSENGCTSHNNMECNAEETFEKGVPQQSALSDSSQDKQVQNLNSVNKTHYQVLTEESMDEDRFHCDCGKSYVLKMMQDRHITKAKGCIRKVSKTKFRAPDQPIGRLDHVKIHMGKRDHKCDICNKLFVSNQSLQIHKKTHLDEKKCFICDRRFTRKQNLNVHIKTHSNEKPYKCDLCGKCFRRKCTLKYHQITREKPHQCPVCSASFGLKAYLKIHQRTHSNLILYSCSKCPRTFRQRHSLRDHLLTNHSSVRLPTFHCIFCDKALQTKNGYYRHIRAHVGESRVFCEYCDKGFSNKVWKHDHIRRRHSSRNAT